MRTKLVNGIEIIMTPEEEAEWDRRAGGQIDEAERKKQNFEKSVDNNIVLTRLADLLADNIPTITADEVIESLKGRPKNLKAK